MRTQLQSQSSQHTEITLVLYLTVDHPLLNVYRLKISQTPCKEYVQTSHSPLYQLSIYIWLQRLQFVTSLWLQQEFIDKCQQAPDKHLTITWHGIGILIPDRTEGGRRKKSKARKRDNPLMATTEENKLKDKKMDQMLFLLHWIAAILLLRALLWQFLFQQYTRSLQTCCCTKMS